jgi:predicted nucleic acid-binding Zn ribbon protein
MPTYEFRCPDGTIIERVFKISEVPSEIPSPNGDGMATRMISGGAGLLFKGSGFYITDYGKDGKKDQRAASSEKSEKSSTASAEGGSSGSSGGGADSGKAADKSSAAPAASAPTKSDKSD